MTIRLLPTNTINRFADMFPWLAEDEREAFVDTQISVLPAAHIRALARRLNIPAGNKNILSVIQAIREWKKKT
jgi:hypothetical protein